MEIEYENWMVGRYENSHAIVEIMEMASTKLNTWMRNSCQRHEHIFELKRIESKKCNPTFWHLMFLQSQRGNRWCRVRKARRIRDIMTNKWSRCYQRYCSASLWGQIWDKVWATHFKAHKIHRTLLKDLRECFWHKRSLEFLQNEVRSCAVCSCKGMRWPPRDRIVDENERLKTVVGKKIDSFQQPRPLTKGGEIQNYRQKSVLLSIK